MMEIEGAAHPSPKNVEKVAEFLIFRRLFHCFTLPFLITSLVIQNTEVDMTNNSPGKHTIDPLMARYMKMVQDQREKVQPLLEETSEKEDVII